MSHSNFYSALKIVLVFFLVVNFVSCTNNATSSGPSSAINEAEYPNTIIGSWEGTINGSEETMSLKKNGTFICHLRKLGFIANTLSQSLPGTITGKWQLVGTKISMEIIEEKNEHVENLRASSDILMLKKDLLMVKSDKGDTCTFKRVSNL